MFKCVPFILSLSIFLIGQQIPDGEPLLLKPPREEVSRGLSYYENILRKNPDLPEAHFGAGHSAYSIENYERAQQEFKTSSQSERKDLQSKSHYNLGNTLHQQGRLEESLMAFRKAIQLDPSDLDAKYNYELTQQMLRQMQSQQQSKPQQSDQDQNDEIKNRINNSLSLLRTKSNRIKTKSLRINKNSNNPNRINPMQNQSWML